MRRNSRAGGLAWFVSPGLCYCRGFVWAAVLAGVSQANWFFCGMPPYEGSSVSIFQEFFASVDRILILGAGLGTGLQFYGVLRS